jgi:4-amino-4-deoxy-L-arabinose transferase-like glycosyltransferase
MLADRSRSWFALVIAAATILWFAMLVGRPLYDPDEGRYAEIPREMLNGGDWVIPHLNGFVYLEKPPLQYWATAIVYAGFGETEWTARLATGIAGYLCLVIVYATAKRLWGRRAALVATLLHSGSALFVLLGHQLTLDMSLCLFLLASLSCFLIAQSSRSDARRCAAWMLGCWAAIALAVLTKGLIGVLIPGFTLVVYLLWQRDVACLRSLNIRWGLPLFFALAAPWFVLAARANREFLWFFFVREHFQRYLTPIEQRTQPWWFFIAVLIVGVLPWLIPALRSLLTGWQTDLARGSFNARRMLWIWSVFVLVFFSLSDSKLIPYILPAIPTLALLCAEPRPHRDGFALARTSLLAGATMTLLFGIGVLGYASAIWSSARDLPLVQSLRPALLVMSAVLIGAFGVTVLCVRRERPLAALASLCAAWFASIAALTVGATGAQAFFSAKDAALLLAQQAAPDAPVFSVQTYEQSLTFYLRRNVRLVDYRDEFALGLRQDPELGIATVEEFRRRWGGLADAYAVMPLATRDRLAEQGVPLREIGRFPNRIVVISRR